MFQEMKMSQHPKPYQQFRKDHLDVYRAYENLGEITANSGPLDIKTRELVKLGMAAASKSESAVQSHTHRALEAGVTSEEIEHALMLGVTTLGFPTMMAALTWAKQAISKHDQ
jgi:4-carboxymuconolactone decarboxylase